MQVADDPLPQVKAVQQGKKHKKDKKNQPERSKDVVISLDHVSYQYERGGNASKALDDVTFDIERGSFIGLIGRNGSGKTTLAKHLNGLIRPTQGTVTVDGLDASKHSVGEMAAHVGFVFQNPDHQIFCSTTKEEIAFGPTALGLDGATVFKRVDEMLTLFDLHRYEDVSPATLGYGERRAVALSSVLAMRTPILVLDEPSRSTLPRHHRETQPARRHHRHDQPRHARGIPVLHACAGIGGRKSRAVWADRQVRSGAEAISDHPQTA